MDQLIFRSQLTALTIFVSEVATWTAFVETVLGYGNQIYNYDASQTISDETERSWGDCTTVSYNFSVDKL